MLWLYQKRRRGSAMMDIAGYRFRIHDLSRLDQRFLLPGLENTDSKFEAPEVSSTGHNELATLAILGGINMLGVVAAYYFGKYKKDKVSLEVEAIAPNGHSIRINVQVDRTSIEPVDNQILKQIKDFLGQGS
jgi:hypothetical protein